jgi:hypothetical protein
LPSSEASKKDPVNEPQPATPRLLLIDLTSALDPYDLLDESVASTVDGSIGSSFFSWDRYCD